MNSHLEARRASSKNWSVWSGWVPTLGHIYDALEDKDRIVTLSKNEVLGLINKTFGDARLEDFQWEPIAPEKKFIMVRIIKKMDHDTEQETVTMYANQLVLLGTKENIKEAEFHRVRLRACDDLADILAAIIHTDDILVLTGGFDLFRERNNSWLVGINYNKDVKTQVIRIPTNLEDNMFLYEGILPTYREKRFKFVYFAMWEDPEKGHSHRALTIHRDFAMECTNVQDTHMFILSKGKIPAPVLRNSDPWDWYTRLVNKDYTLFETEKEKKEREQQRMNYLKRQALFKAEKDENRKKEQKEEFRQKLYYYSTKVFGYFIWGMFIAMICILLWGSNNMTEPFGMGDWKDWRKKMISCSCDN